MPDTAAKDLDSANAVRQEWQNRRHGLLKDGWSRARSSTYAGSFLWIALPITAQALMASSRTVFDVFMTSSLGFEEVAVVGYGSRIVFILILLVLGICNGAGVVVAQFYGGGNERRARDAIGTTMLLSFTISTLGFVLVLALSGFVAAWSSPNPAIQQLTLDYLVPASAMVLPYSIAFSIAVGLRSVGRPGVATWAAIIGLLSNVVLNYALIFGNFGAPALGVQGAAYASVLSFAIEAVIVAICALVLFDNRLFSPSRLTAYLNLDTVRKTLRIGMPIALGSVIWAVGIFMYSVITAQAGPQALAVLALVTPIESMAIAVMIGLSSTTNVIVGQALGRGDFRGATTDAISLVIWTILAAIILGLILWCLKPSLLWLYAGAGDDVLEIADTVFDVLACVLIIRAINVTLVVGILRAGADTVSPIIMDVAAQWLVAIPLTAAAVIWLGLPFPWVFLAINAEEIARLVMVLWRVTRFPWLRRIKPESVL